MIVVLKIILALLAVADILTLRFIAKDFMTTKKQDGFDELSIWRKVRFNATTYFIMSAMLSLFVFLVYFVIVKMSIG